MWDPVLLSSCVLVSLGTLVRNYEYSKYYTIPYRLHKCNDRAVNRYITKMSTSSPLPSVSRLYSLTHLSPSRATYIHTHTHTHICHMSPQRHPHEEKHTCEVYIVLQSTLWVRAYILSKPSVLHEQYTLRTPNAIYIYIYIYINLLVSKVPTSCTTVRNMYSV